MHSTSSSAQDIFETHSKANRLTNHRQTVDSLHAKAEDKKSFKETLEKSITPEKELKSADKKSHEKTERHFSDNDIHDSQVENESVIVLNQNVMKPLTIDNLTADFSLNPSALTDNGLSHAITEDVSLLTNQEFGLDFPLTESETIKTEQARDVSGLLFNGFAPTQGLPGDFTQTPQLIGAESYSSLVIAQNISVANDSAIQNSIAITKASYLLNTQQQPFSQDNGTLSYGLMAADSKIISAQSGNNELNQSAMLMHNKIGSQLNTLLSKGQIDGSGLEATLDSDFTVELSEPEIKTQVLNATEQRGAVASIDKVVVSAHVKVGMPGWSDQIAERTASLASQNIKQAEIQLNPQDMGVINVKISVNQDQVAVTFTAQNAGVREALDQSVQRLRDTLEAEGMDLVQADVGNQNPQSDDSANEQGSERIIHLPDGEGEVQNIHVEIPSSGIDDFV